MSSSTAFFFFLVNVSLLLTLSSAADPFVSYDFEVSYITASPLGVPQQVLFLLSLAVCLKSPALLADLHHGTLLDSNVVF